MQKSFKNSIKKRESCKKKSVPKMGHAQLIAIYEEEEDMLRK